MTSKSLRVGIDARALKRGPAGVATYVRNLLEHLSELEPFHSESPGNNFLFSAFRLPTKQLTSRWDVFHAPGYTAPPLNFCPVVLSVHDVSYLKASQWYPYPIDPFRAAFYRRSLGVADRILAPSDFSAGEIAAIFPQLQERIRKVHLGVSSFFERDETLAEMARTGLRLPSRFILHVGDIHPRRRVESISAAVASIGLPLVLVGRVLAGGEAFLNWPLRFEGLSMEMLKGIYSAADALVHASEYEGFGLPVLEAMACGVPVVAANRSSLPEVCGDAALILEPNPSEIAEGIRAVLRDHDGWVQRGLARARLFPWKSTALKTRAVYQELV